MISCTCFRRYAATNWLLPTPDFGTYLELPSAQWLNVDSREQKPNDRAVYLMSRRADFSRVKSHSQFIRVLFGHACSNCRGWRDVRAQRYCRRCRRRYMRQYRRALRRNTVKQIREKTTSDSKG